MDNIKKGEKMKDFDKWSKDKMNRKDAEEQIKTWSLRNNLYEYRDNRLWNGEFIISI